MLLMKKCTKCNKEKDLIQFGKRKASKDGLSYVCKECKSKSDKEYSENNKEYIKTYQKNYYKNNKDVIIDRARDYYENNKDYISERYKEYYEKNKESIITTSKYYYENNKENKLEYQKEYYQKNKEKCRSTYKEWYIKNQDKIKEYSKIYHQDNKDKVKEYKKNYYSNNKEYINEYMRNYWYNRKYIKSWRGILYRSLKYFSIKKVGNTLSLLKYTPEMLKLRIECQFKDGMSWDNYGEWQIDHKKPLSKFDSNTKPHIVNALCNLQPLWREENINKSNKWK